MHSCFGERPGTLTFALPVLAKQLGVGLRILAVNPVEADVYLIRKACKGVGSDEGLLYSILLGRTNEDMDLLKVRQLQLLVSPVLSSFSPPQRLACSPPPKEKIF